MPYNSVNIATVAKIANALQELRSQIVFVGGAVISLYIDDPAADEIRPTYDIDLTVQVSGYFELTQLQERLSQLGFSPNPQGHAICSYIFQEISVDIMPSEDGPIGPANRWYKPGFDYLQEMSVEDITIRILSAPYFLASKFEAFLDRGGDHRTSHDFEDIIYIINNRLNVVDEVNNADQNVKNFLKHELEKINNNPYLEEIISSHLNQVTAHERFPIVLEKIRRMIV